jgi:two-component system response regulator RstA
MSYKILIVEDDIELAAMIRDFLNDEGYTVDHIDDGSLAINKINNDQPDLVLLDIMLPGTQGIEVARQVRDHYRGVLIMLTAKDDEITVVNSLNRGADAFLEKPVRPHILLAHIKAHLRRHTDQATNATLTLENHGLTLDMGKQEAYINESLLELTTAELQLLDYFITNAGQIVTRDGLYKQLRNIEYDGVDRSMDMRISTLRKKMNDEKPPYRYIKTVRRQGYMLAR